MCPSGTLGRATDGPAEWPRAQGVYDKRRKVGWWTMATTSPRRGSGPGRATRPRWVWWAAWGVIAALSVVITLFSFPPYLPFVPDVERLPVDPGFPDQHTLIIALHAVPSGLALLLGPFQFVGPIRRRYPAVHRNMGRAYLICVALGSVTGVAAGILAATGLRAQVGFLLLVVIWFYSAAMAYTAIRNGQVQLHRVWMIRNFALTFAAVWLRLVILVGQTFFPTVPFGAVYDIAVWSSILCPLVIAEWFIVQRTLRPLALKQRQS